MDMETQKNIPPSTLLDVHGYPTAEYLQFLRDYKPHKYFSLTDFIEMLATEGWWAAGSGVVVKCRKRDLKIDWLELHTGGWSGNEDIIREILSNKNLTEAVRVTGEGFFYCKKYNEFGITGDSNCGKSCDFYKPRNGKNGICQHWGYTYEEGDKSYRLFRNGVKKLIK